MRAVALRYALAPACILLAALLHLSPAGPALNPTGLFAIAVLAAAWFGGAGPGFAAAVLATLALPQLIPLSYPLLGGFVDLPRFITFSVAGLAVGWWSFRRRQAEAALRDQERYACAMNASDDGFWDWVPAGDTVYASPRLLEIYGFAPGTKFAGRDDLLARIPFHPEDHAPLVRAIADHFAGKTARFDIEARFIRDGETRRVHLTGMAARDASGAVVRWTGTVRDVTERKSAQDKLRESEARFRALTELSADWYWRQDEDLRFTYVSHQVADTELYPREWVIGKTRWELPGITPLSFTWADHKAALNARRPFRDLEYAREGLNGRTEYVSISGAPIFDEQGDFRGYQGVGRSITERKRAEEALRESEERYERVVAATEAGFWDWDVVQDKYYVSPRLLEMSKLPPGTVIANRADFQARVPLHPEDLEKWQQEIKALFAGGGSRLSAELRAVFGAEMRWYRLDGMCFRDASGRVVRWTGSSIDVTARKQAEQALRDSEARKSAMFETALDCIVSIDHEGRVVEFNPAAERTFGYRRAEALGKELAELIIPPRLRAQHRQGLARYLKSGEGRVLGKRTEMSAVRADGSEFSVELSVTRIATEGAPLFTAYLRDITGRKLAEEALRASEERYEIAMAASESGYWDWDIPSNRYFVSARANELAGFPPENTFAGRGDFRARIPVHPDDWVKWEAAREKLFAGTGERLAMEVRYIVRGETRWHSLQAMCRRDETGKVVRWTGSATDVTARKLAEEELRESEARFRILTELSSDWYWRQDEQLRFVYMTNHATVLGGYTDDSSLSKTWWELEGLAPLSASWPEHQAVLAARQPFRDLELRRVMPDGSINYLSIGGAPTFDEQGRFRGYQGVGRDITERKRIEEELRSRQEMLGLAQKSAQAIAFEWRIGANRPGDNRWSPELAAMHGITSEAYDGSVRRWKKLIHPEDWPAVREGIKHAYRTGELAAEYRVVHPDASVHWLHARGRMLFDAGGRPVRMVGFMHDVTQRRHAEEALRLSEERHALAVASADEGIFDWDLVSDRVYVSQRARELFALPVGELWHPRREWRRILNYHPEDTKLQRDSIKALIAGETSKYDVEFRVIFPDGSVRWFRQRAIALRDAAGKAYRMVGSVGDVTDRKRAQEELQRLERQLRQAQRLEAMGTLAGGIAHDFNNILGAILGYGEMAQRGAPKGSRLARDLDSIIVAGERGRALVDRVLAFSRSAVGERVPVHVEGVVREALDLVSAKLPANIKLQAMLSADRSAIVGDATQVHQVLMNLATNAIQAMPGGGTLRVSLDVSRIDASHVPTIGILAPASEYLVLRVADTGTGIAPDILERIFDPFFTTKEVGTGTGLGLSLVHGIVSDLGGAIDVASTAGAGSTFTVYLPRSGEALEAREDEEPEIPRGDGQRVLIVDDEEPLVRLATRTLEELGYAPVGFTSSTAALEAFRAAPERFDALITDERMPGMSGSALIREVRGIRGGMPIVLMSGYVGGAVTRRARSAGAEEVLKKPLSARDLATSLARVLRL